MIIGFIIMRLITKINNQRVPGSNPSGETQMKSPCPLGLDFCHFSMQA